MVPYNKMLLVLKLRSKELAVKTSDVRDRDRLWTLCLASTSVSTVTKTKLIHLCNHSLCTASALNATLWQLCK